MLEKYKEVQPIVYSLLKKSINNNKLSHAYLFDINNNPNNYDVILSFVKDIFCIDKSQSERENICTRIDNNNFLELKIIDPMGLVIKKEQLNELQEEYSMSSIEADKRIYIINDCDKMNLQAANSILKFLEEPVCNIIAILVTSNINNVLKTIISRCQVITFKKDSVKYMSDSFSNIASILLKNRTLDVDDSFLERRKKLFNDTINFISYLEENGDDTFICIKKLWNDIYKDRVESVYAIDIMLYFYYDVFKYKVFGQAVVFNEYDFLIKKISNCSTGSVIFKLEKLLDAKNMFLSNVNINMVMDYLIISFGRC